MRLCRVLISLILLITTSTVYANNENYTTDPDYVFFEPLDYTKYVHLGFTEEVIERYNQLIPKAIKAGALPLDFDFDDLVGLNLPTLEEEDSEECTCSSSSFHFEMNAISKALRPLQRFCKKHHKAILITTAVVVGSVIVYKTYQTHVTKKICPTKITQIKQEAVEELQKQVIDKKQAVLQEVVFNPLYKDFSDKELSDLIDISFAKPLQTPQGFIEAPHTPDSLPDFNLEYNPYQFKGELYSFQGKHEQAVENFTHALEITPNAELYLERGFSNLKLGNLNEAVEDFYTYESKKPSFKEIILTPMYFKAGMIDGIWDSGGNLATFGYTVLTHPIDTFGHIVQSIGELSKLAWHQEWQILKEVLVPECYQLAEMWDTLSYEQKTREVGYITGKYGGDIFLPGASVKLLKKGSTIATEFYTIANKITFSQTACLAEGIALAGSGEAYGFLLESSETTCLRAKGLGFSSEEILNLNKAGRLEETIGQKLNHLTLSKKSSIQFFKEVKEKLAPYKGKYMPEAEVRNLIHKTGLPTFPRPKGIPENFRVRVSDRGGGMLYEHPIQHNTFVRVMPGSKHAKWPVQRRPYVVQEKGGTRLDKFRNILDKDQWGPSHIPLEEYVFLEGSF